MHHATRGVAIFPLASCLVIAGILPAQAKPGKNRDLSSVKQIVVAMMENRSFDHALGWHPVADGIQAGLSYLDDAGVAHPTTELSPDYQGCGRSDPDHSWSGGRIDLADGAMDGFLLNTNCSPLYCPRGGA
jgi:phospholipase C